MTLDDAITHAREVAEEQRKIWKKYSDRYGRGGYAKCINCAAEHEQLAEWLEELKAYKEIGTIEELSEGIKNDIG